MATVNFTTSEAEAVIIALKQAKRKLEGMLDKPFEGRPYMPATTQDEIHCRAVRLRLAETTSALERINRLG